MQATAPVIQALKSLIRELVSQNFAQLEVDGRAGRLKAEELAAAVTQYGRTLIDVPDEALEALDIYAIADRVDVLRTDIDLWTAEEGRSDLTLSVTIQTSANDTRVFIDDLHVL
jgi:hypothetical protein